MVIVDSDLTLCAVAELLRGLLEYCFADRLSR